MKRYTWILFLFLFTKLYTVSAQSVTYTTEDSLKVETFLADASQLSAKVNRPLFFAYKFIGLPYVAATLEVNENEKLIVNLRELDCTTFVETVLALCIADRSEERNFKTFTKALSALRYRKGKLSGYTSRLHYFSDWIADNEKLGLIEEITDANYPFIAVQTLKTDYMSKHPEKYKHLKNNEVNVKIIQLQEKELTGQKVRYIPKSLFAKDSLSLPIKNGDVLALTTNMDGLDIAHLGFAVWEEDGTLHLLHASSRQKKVILDSKTLYQYSSSLKTQTGTRVIRLVEL